ncbi:hypothetical protein FJY94_08865 [Candidatus Kaiserbacteria bacterium]|nr:hypothetical protein [Candidatus Kaiserbacteria bacterium]
MPRRELVITIPTDELELGFDTRPPVLGGEIIFRSIILPRKVGALPQLILDESRKNIQLAIPWPSYFVIPTLPPTIVYSHFAPGYYDFSVVLPRIPFDGVFPIQPTIITPGFDVRVKITPKTIEGRVQWDFRPW